MDAVVFDDALTSPDPSGPGESRSAPTGDARAFRLPGGVMLLDVAAGVGLVGGAGDLLLDGLPLPVPACTLLLGPAGASRHLTATRGAGPTGAVRITLLRHGSPVAPPLDAVPGDARDFARAAARLPVAERARLLRFLAGTCAPILRVSAHPGFASLLHALARGLMPAGAGPSLRPLTRVGRSLLSLWSVPGPAVEGAWHLLTPRRAVRVPPPIAGTLLLEGADDLGAALLLPPAGQGGTPHRPLPLAAPRGAPPPLLAPVGPGGSPDAVSDALARRVAAGDAAAARLLRHRRLLAPVLPPRGLDDVARPVGGALELALSDGAGGVFVSGWLRDPFGLAGHLSLRDPRTGATADIPHDRVHRVARPDLADRLARAPHGAERLPGFVAHLPDAERRAGGPVPQWNLDLHLASGEAVELTAPPGLLPPRRARDLVLRAVHPAALRPAILDEVLTPAVARLQSAALAALAPPEVLHLGAPRRARVAVVVPLYRNLRFLRFQFAAFARDPDFRAKAHLVLVLDSPEQRAEAEHLLRGLHAVHDLPATLVVMAENAGYAPACNAGVAAAEGDLVLLLNSDVVPDAPGWLAALRRPLERDPRVVATGPKLLFDDDSVQHAGLFFLRHGPEGDWLNGHYAKGLPRRHPAANRAGAVPGVTGAALLVRRAAFEAVGGLCTDYVVGDYEDSDLCLGLRARGGEIRYVPSAELYHFERQSIAGHAGYARTLACAHNRRLHHHRWDTGIEALMRRFSADRRAGRGT